MVRALALAALLASAMTAGADPLTGAPWRVTGLAGLDLPPGVQPTLAFAPEGAVTGHAGCNRYRGRYVRDGAAVTFSALIGTRMACARDVMAVESRFFAALAAVTGLALTAEGGLELLGSDGPPLVTATR